jgi:hypothetical protein
VMRVGLDGETHAEVAVQVRSVSAQPQTKAPAWMS